MKTIIIGGQPEKYWKFENKKIDEKKENDEQGWGLVYY